MTITRKIFYVIVILSGLLSIYLLLPAKSRAQQIPNDVHQTFRQAQQALDRKDYLETIKLIDGYLKGSSTAAHPLAYVILGNAWHGQGNLFEARKALQQGFELNPHSFELCFNLATVAYELNDFERAANLFEKAHQLADKPDGDLLYRAAVSHSKTANHPDAQRVLQRLAGQKTELQQSWLQLLMQTDIELAAWNDAEQHLTSYLERFNTSSADWKLLSQVHIKQKDLLPAAAAMEIAYALEESDSSDWKELVHLYISLNLPLRAVRSLEKAYGSSPSPAQCEEMAKGYAQAHRFDRAIHYAEAAATEEPSGSRYVELGKLYYQAGRWREAADALEAGLQFEGADGLAYLLLGYTAIELGSTDAARLAFEKAAQHESHKTQAQQAMQALQLY
jgi:tetratricopeptide (TPR) repeat protein